MGSYEGEGRPIEIKNACLQRASRIPDRVGAGSVLRARFRTDEKGPPRGTEFATYSVLRSNSLHAQRRPRLAAAAMTDRKSRQLCSNTRAWDGLGYVTSHNPVRRPQYFLFPLSDLNNVHLTLPGPSLVDRADPLLDCPKLKSTMALSTNYSPANRKLSTAHRSPIPST